LYAKYVVQKRRRKTKRQS